MIFEQEQLDYVQGAVASGKTWTQAVIDWYARSKRAPTEEEKTLHRALKHHQP